MSSCRSCRAQIVWLETARGRRIPCDPSPEARRRSAAGELFEPGRGDVISHFATCPNAGRHRRRTNQKGES